MFRVLQKLHRYFNDTAISIFSFSRLLFSNFPVVYVLKLKDFQSLIE